MDTPVNSSRLRNATIALAGIGVVVAATALAIRSDIGEARAAFAAESRMIERALVRRLDGLAASLHSLAGMHHAMPDLSPRQLAAFATEARRGHPALQAILQLRVTDATEEPNALSGQTPSGGRMIVNAVESTDARLSRLVGADAASPLPASAIESAVASGQVVLAATGTMAPHHLLLLKAVYKGPNAPTAPTQRRAQVDGAYALLIDADGFLADLSREHPHVAMRLTTGVAGASQELYANAPVRDDKGIAGLLPVLRDQRSVRFGEQQVAIELTARVGGGNFDPAGWLALVVTLFGLYLAAVLVITARRRAAITAEDARQQVFEQKERAHVTLQSIGEAVITTDPTGVVDFMNPVAERLTGWHAADATGRHLNEIFALLSETDGCALPDPIARALRDHDESEAPALMIRSDGATFAVIENAAAIRDSDGHFTGAVLIIRDVSRERHLVREMEFQATHDPLTRLINRRQFGRELAAAVDDARTSGGQHALMCIDVDQFKAINDSCGHFGADQLLKQVAIHLGENVRRLDCLARLGGDEFGVLLHDVDIDRAMHGAEALRQQLKGQPLHWDERSYRISVSIGVVAITRDSGGPDDVLRAADAACYVAKDQGRNRVHRFQSDDKMLAQRSGDAQWLHRLRDAIDNDGLVIHAQSIFPLAAHSRHAPMCELLVRLRGEDGLVPPMTFIPAAERFNLMFDLDLWVIGAAFRQLARFWRQDPGDRRIFTINLSGQSVDHPDLQQAIISLAERHAIDPRRICFEITETSVIANIDRALQLMDRLRQRGFLFALDDFGTGLSSFAYLKRLPVDFLKIDAEFVRDLLTDPVDKAMVETIKHISGVLGMLTIAEAIEDEATCNLLTEMGIDLGQGYFLARPAPVEFDVRKAATLPSDQRG